MKIQDGAFALLRAEPQGISRSLRLSICTSPLQERKRSKQLIYSSYFHVTSIYLGTTLCLLYSFSGFPVQLLVSQAVPAVPAVQAVVHCAPHPPVPDKPQLLVFVSVLTPFNHPRVNLHFASFLPGFLPFSVSLLLWTFYLFISFFIYNSLLLGPYFMPIHFI